jgi:hypothetical protein
MRTSPSMEGFRAVFRRPALGLAEVAWRWTSATVAWLLFCFLLFEYLDSLPVTKADLFLLGSGVPRFVRGAIQRILLSDAIRFLVAAAICLLAICITWIFAASVGRAATLEALIDQARDESPSEAPSSPAADSERSTSAAPSRLIPRALVLLYCWRAALLVTAVSAFMGAAIVAGSLGSDHDARPGIAFLLFLVLSWAIAILWYSLDWLLSTAPIFAIRDGDSAFRAISKAVTFVCRRFGAVVRTSALFGVVHLIIFFVASSLASAPLGLVRILPPGAIFLCVVFVTLLYFVLIDFLRVARLAAYICIAAPRPGMQPAPAEY